MDSAGGDASTPRWALARTDHARRVHRHKTRPQAGRLAAWLPARPGCQPAWPPGRCRRCRAQRAARSGDIREAAVAGCGLCEGDGEVQAAFEGVPSRRGRCGGGSRQRRERGAAPRSPLPARCFAASSHPRRRTPRPTPTPLVALISACAGAPTPLALPRPFPAMPCASFPYTFTVPSPPTRFS